jgi:hypothetical protein
MNTKKTRHFFAAAISPIADARFWGRSRRGTDQAKRNPEALRFQRGMPAAALPEARDRARRQAG